MTISRRHTAFALAVAVAAAALPAGAQSTHIVVPADKVHWAPAPPILPAGAQLAVLEGDPGQKGTVVMRLKLPANYDIPAHWHTMTERVTVLSGSFHVGMGDRLNRQASQTLEPAGFVSLPAKMHHYAFTTSPVIVQIDLEGPFDLFYVNPADNPQKPQTRR